ncbi:unnamed protein product [Cuscuta europaea]|uniref:Uncharacterized protein n=1 Tax=Cuscuta europaea TaxID=41803 RepID=A0A9P0ZB31_CUSEU|nr:unnamed protein product [Cuscuta europaea]
MKNGDLVFFQIKRSLMHKIHIKVDLVPQIIRFIYQLTTPAQNNSEKIKKFGDLTISVEFNRSGYNVKMAKFKGSFIRIPMGPQNSSLFKFLNIFSNFAGIPNSMPDESIFLQHRKKPELPLIQAFSDASDDFYHSDDSLFTDDFLGHATKSDRRPPISYPEEIRKSKFNTAICWKTNFITSENYMPTENLNTQLKIYRKSQKNKRRHSMQTRSQSRDFPWN